MYAAVPERMVPWIRMASGFIVSAFLAKACVHSQERVEDGHTVAERRERD